MKNFITLVCLILLVCGFADAQEKVEIAKVKAEKVKTTKPVENTEKTEPRDIEPMNLSMVGTDSANTVPLTLNDAIKRALENNNDIEVAKTDVKIAENQLRSFRGAYDRTFNISPTYSRSSSTGSSSSNDFRLTTDSSKLLERGGNYDIFFNSSRTGRNSSNNTSFNQTSGLGGSSSSTYVSSVGVRFTQPLYRGREIDQTRKQIKVQKKRLQQSDSDFRQQTIGVISQVQAAYWNLVFALRDQQNQVANLNLSKENLRIVEAKISAGTAAPLQRAEVETELANRESGVISATELVSISQNSLKQLLLKEVSDKDWNANFVPTDAPVFSNDSIKLEDAVKDAVDNRPELRRLKLEREINDLDIQLAKNLLKPKVDFVSSFSLQGISLGKVNTNSTTFNLIDPNLSRFNASSYLYSLICPTPNPPTTCGTNSIPMVTSAGSPNYFNGGYARSIANFFRKDAANYSFGVTIQFPLKNTTAKAELAIVELQKSQIDARTRNQEQRVIAEVRNAVQAVETARQKVLSSRRGRENAEIQLNGERKLYEAGRSTTFLLFQRENTLTNARNSEIRAETDYNKALADLQRVTSSTFRVNGIEIDSPIEEK
jgi:outer membrane protein TolC